MFVNYPKTLFILMGLQASGKTTFAKKVLRDKVYVSLDQLHTRSKEKFALEQAIQAGLSCVVDNTNPTEKDRARYLSLVKTQGYKTVGIYFSSVVERCLQRNEQRTGKGHVPLKAILSTAKRLKQPSPREGFDELYYVKIENNEFVISAWDETL